MCGVLCPVFLFFLSLLLQIIRFFFVLVYRHVPCFLEMVFSLGKKRKEKRDPWLLV